MADRTAKSGQDTGQQAAEGTQRNGANETLPHPVKHPVKHPANEAPNGEIRETADQTTGPSADQTTDEPQRDAGERPRRRGRGRRRIVITAVAVVAAAAIGAVAAAAGAGGDGGGNGGADSGLPPATGEVTRGTLQDTKSAEGTLGYGPASTAVARRPGTLTWLPDSGERIGRGDPLYRLDDLPVPLLYGSVPAHRDLAPGVEGPDVEQLEENLAELGYSDLTVDEEYTDRTAAAVEAWQADLGLPETGTVALGQAVFAGGEVRVEGLLSEVGQPVAPGQNVLSHTGTDRLVTVPLDPGDQRLAQEEAVVSVGLPDGGETEGVVTEVATVVTPGEAGAGGAGGSGDGATTALEVLVALTDEEAVADLDRAAVDVTFTAGEREDVLTVPVTALVALSGGGFGIEVVEGSTTRYLPVETGLFAAGRVEVTGAGLAEGMTVGMPG
jgi:peptidoglycan hydrolase-like protein with peptidoglycan-binding domain